MNSLSERYRALESEYDRLQRELELADTLSQVEAIEAQYETLRVIEEHLKRHKR